MRELIESIRQKFDIVEIIGSRLNLDRNHKAICPFHDDKVPSFSVNSKDQYFHCFGCHVGGDVFTFIQLIENVTFIESVRLLASLAGMSVGSFDSNYINKLGEENNIREILKESAKFYQQNLSVEARVYLNEKRGLSDEIIRKYMIGFANGGLRNFLIGEKGYSRELCIESGVLQHSNGESRDFFYNRVIFPHLRRGQVVNITGRILGDGEPKYLHLPGKITCLYNEDVLFENEVIITEGIFDCLSAIQVGLHAVATFGTSLFGEEHAEKFKNVESVHVIMDSDTAGEKAAMKIGKILGEKARIVSLPDGNDLNDFLIKYDRPELELLIKEGQDFIKKLISEIPPSEDKVILSGKLEAILREISILDEYKSEAYLAGPIKSRFALTKIEIDQIRKRVSEFRKRGKSSATKTCNTEKHSILTATFDGLVDIVEWEDKPAFLVKRDNSLEIVCEIEIGDNLFVPPQKDHIPFLLPRGSEVLKYQNLNQHLSGSESDSALYIDLFKYFENISEMPSGGYYDLLVAWTIHTYLVEKVHYSPIICLFAVPERGKSRTGKGLINVAYRGIHVESLRDAYLVRLANNFGASVFFDVKDIWRKAEKSGSEDILLHRFEKGAKVPRVLYPEKGAFKDTVYYDIFGPTVIATNEGVHKILDTRCISINMPVSRKVFDNDITPNSALQLKERLVEFRARHIGRGLPDVSKPTQGRLGDIVKPLLQVVKLVMPQRMPVFLELIEGIRQGRKMETAASLEGEILTVIIQLKDLVEHATLPVKTVTDRFNEARNDRYKFTYQKMGRRLAAMGFKKAKTSDGSAAIIWIDEEINRMKLAFGLEETPESPETSISVSSQPGDTGLSDVSGVLQGNSGGKIHGG